MKLNKYIYEKLVDAEETLQPIPITEEDIEDWIVEWYGKTFKQPNREGKPSLPPLWLANWRPRIRPLHEQEVCGVDEC
jgi:hypothetical protein